MRAFDRLTRLVGGAPSLALPCMAVLALGVVIAQDVSPVAAQEAERETPRDGFWISGGIGGGWNTSEGLDDARRGGGAAYLRLGGTPDPRFLLGGELIGWGREDDGTTTTRANATFSVLFYPDETGRFFVKGGFGGASVEVETEDGEQSREQGFGTTLGLGYDVRLSRSLSLTPAANWLFQAFDAGPGLTSTNTLFLVTVGLSWH